MINHDFAPKSFVVLGHGPQGVVWTQILKELNLLHSHLRSTNLEDQILPKGVYYVILGPDLYHGKIIETLNKNAKDPKAFIFAHGYSKTFKLFETSTPCWLLAPKAIAPKLWEAYKNSKDLSIVIDALPSEDLSKAEKLARLIGASKVIRASFETEAYCDLFTEQTLLCHGLPVLLQKSHEFLVSKGIPKELAATELMEESLLMLEMIKERGIAGMLKKISTTAAVGAAQGSVDNFEQIWTNLKNNQFHQYLMDQIERGSPASKAFIDSFEKSSFDQTRRDSVKSEQ